MPNFAPKASIAVSISFLYHFIRDRSEEGGAIEGLLTQSGFFDNEHRLIWHDQPALYPVLIIYLLSMPKFRTKVVSQCGDWCMPHSPTVQCPTSKRISLNAAEGSQEGSQSTYPSAQSRKKRV